MTTSLCLLGARPRYQKESDFGDDLTPPCTSASPQYSYTVRTGILVFQQLRVYTPSSPANPSLSYFVPGLSQRLPTAVPRS